MEMGKITVSESERVPGGYTHIQCHCSIHGDFVVVNQFPVGEAITFACSQCLAIHNKPNPPADTGRQLRNASEAAGPTETCRHCKGSGREPNSGAGGHGTRSHDYADCFRCRGYGRLRVSAPIEKARATNSIELIVAERQRQKEIEGWTVEHDDHHDVGELALMAAAYAVAAFEDDGELLAKPLVLEAYAYLGESGWFKPKDAVRNLVRAGALIVAELERRQRALAVPAPASQPEDGK